MTFFKSYFSPMSSAHFELNNKATRAKALAQIWSRQRKRWFVFPRIDLLARVLRIDPLIDRLAAKKDKKALDNKAKVAAEDLQEAP
jgi:hypothetical protein